MTAHPDRLALADWRRQVAELYAAIRHHPDPLEAWRFFRARRDRLFQTHPQTPLTPAQQAHFAGLLYFHYNPAWRISVTIEREAPPAAYSVDLGVDGVLHYTRVAQLHLTWQDTSHSLSLFWLEGYGGGLFLPFGDATNGALTYGGGRYLLDAIKGADLGLQEAGAVLDFNFAYNPSCAYNPQWVCPLTPPENRLPLSVTAGEQMPPDRWQGVNNVPG